MQKLKWPFPRLRNENGSSLVMALTMSLVLGIMVIGFIQITGAATGREVARLDELRAVQAAESGAVLGGAWLKASNHSAFASALSTGATLSDIVPGLVLNGFPVQVDIKRLDSSYLLSSTAASSGKIGFNKIVSLRITFSKEPSGAYGTFFRNLMTTKGGNTKGIRKQFYDGPVRSNTAIRFFSTSPGNRCEFDAKVSLYNIDPSSGLPLVNTTYGTGHFGNDYRHGLAAGGASSSDLDGIFDWNYDPTAPRAVMQLNTQGATALNLSTSTNKSVTFGVTGGTPYYSYYNAGGNLQTVQYSASSPLLLHVSGSAVLVHGTVKGQVTVFTDPGKMITVSGNTLYDGYSPGSLNITDSGTNFKMGFTSPNVLALYSGANLTIDNAATNAISAQLFACANDTASIAFTANKKNNAVTLIGSRTVGQNWDEKQGNDQVTFNAFFDRRRLSAPGLGYVNLSSTGDTISSMVCSDWREQNR